MDKHRDLLAAASIYAVMNADIPTTRVQGPLGTVITGLLQRDASLRLTGGQAAALIEPIPNTTVRTVPMYSKNTSSDCNGPHDSQVVRVIDVFLKDIPEAHSNVDELKDFGRALCRVQFDTVVVGADREDLALSAVAPTEALTRP